MILACRYLCQASFYIHLFIFVFICVWSSSSSSSMNTNEMKTFDEGIMKLS